MAAELPSVIIVGIVVDTFTEIIIRQPEEKLRVSRSQQGEYSGMTARHFLRHQSLSHSSTHEGDESADSALEFF